MENNWAKQKLTIRDLWNHDSTAVVATEESPAITSEVTTWRRSLECVSKNNSTEASVKLDETDINFILRWPGFAGVLRSTGSKFIIKQSSLTVLLIVSMIECVAEKFSQ